MTPGVMGEFGLEDIVQINDILREASIQHTLAKACVDDMQKRQEDILHEIEFGDHTNRELAKLAKELKEVRKERRIAKNIIQIVGPILRWEEDNRSAYNKISQAVALTRKIDREQKEAVYHKKSENRVGEVIEHVE